MSESIYKSCFSSWIKGVLDTRKALGYVCHTYASLFTDFDRYCAFEHPEETVLTENLVHSWVMNGKAINSGTQCRAAAMRLLAEYIRLSGQEAYLLPTRYFSRQPPAERYIFSDHDMASLFSAIDQMPESRTVLYSNRILPVLFRLIYTCGLRPKEGRELERKHINLETGEILITNTKKKKERFVVMAEDMRILCVNYDRMRQFFYEDNPYFFPGSESAPIKGSWLNRQFQLCWARANPDVLSEQLPHVTIYNLRHRFATYNINRWLEQGKDMNAMLPKLRTYMGHHTLSETAYYIHMLPENLLKNKGIDWESFTDIIPEAKPWQK